MPKNRTRLDSLRSLRSLIVLRHRTTVPVLAFTLLLCACGRSADAGKETGAPEATEVRVITVHGQDIQITDELSGRLSAIEVADVRPQVDGIVQKRLFVEGQTVQAGQPLYQLDAASYQATYDTDVGTLAKARATYRAAEITAQRYRALLKIKGVSAQDAENFIAAADEAKGDVMADEGALEAARVNLQRTRILAPISGTIGKSTVTAGALVTADQTTALSTIQSLDQMYLDVTRPSIEGLRLRKALTSGQLQNHAPTVQLILEDGSVYAQAGKVLFSDVTVDPITGSITLRSVFPNAEHDLLPGMFVRATFSEGTQHAAILVPQQVVTRRSDGQATVWVVDAKRHVRQRFVTATQPYRNQWVVMNGLQAGERVVTSDGDGLSDGAKVNPVEESVTVGNGISAAAESGASAVSVSGTETHASDDTPAGTVASIAHAPAHA